MKEPAQIERPGHLAPIVKSLGLLRSRPDPVRTYDIAWDRTHRSARVLPLYPDFRLT